MELIGSLIALIAILIGAVIWLLPIIFIMASSRTGGKEKFAWILAVIFITWFAWIFYLLLAPLNKQDSLHYR
ncbi:MAG: hypothetical protein KUG75_15985 [Pseudomonadales bacterium]|nr:hypothetical protein [Pseudomonadales bacterium]